MAHSRAVGEMAAQPVADTHPTRPGLPPLRPSHRSPGRHVRCTLRSVLDVLPTLAGNISMPRNQLKSFPTAVIRRGLAHFHPGCLANVQLPVDPDDVEPARLTDSVPPGPGETTPGDRSGDESDSATASQVQS